MKDFSSPLNNLKVASPCAANWNGMYGNDQVRFCGECKLNVYNLSGMSKIEAENLLYTTEGRLCVRYFQRADGTVITQDCPVGWRALKKRVSNLAAAACSLMLGIFGVFMFTAPVKEETVVGKLEALHTPTPTPAPTPFMGNVAPPMMGAVAPRNSNAVMGDIPRPSKSKDDTDDQKVIDDAVQRLSKRKAS